MDSAAALTGPALHVDVTQRLASGFALSAALDATMAPGSILVLFGPSGAGKTTILRHIAGLERPDAGLLTWGQTATAPVEVWFDSQKALWQPPQQRRVGLVFQQPTLFPHLTVSENVRYGVRDRQVRHESGTSPAPVRVVASEGSPVPDWCQTGVRLVPDLVAALVGLEQRYPRQLSGGEAQRVALARALAPSPRLLLLDEPFASLDAPTRGRLRRDLRALLQQTGTPAILVTHDRTEALAMGDAMAVVIGGRIQQHGPIADVFSRPADADVAAALGIEAVLPARIVEASDGLLTVDVGGVALHVAERDPLDAGAAVYACIRAEDVTVETRSPTHASTRNHLAATITAIVSEGPIDRVSLDCGFPLDALITRRSRDELELAPGTRVTAAIKATSIHLVARYA